MQKNRVIVVSGWKQSGKDTLGDYLVVKYGYKKLSFAKALKDMVSRDYNIQREMFDDNLTKEMPLFKAEGADDTTNAFIKMFNPELVRGFWTPRALCIFEGSVKRAINKDYWVDKVIEAIKTNPYDKFVICDLRYRSEIVRLSEKLNDLKTVRIERWDSSASSDPSEMDLNDYKFNEVLENKSTVQDYYKLIDERLF